MVRDHALDHLAFSFSNAGHVRRGGSYDRSESLGVMNEISYFRAPDFVFTR